MDNRIVRNPSSYAFDGYTYANSAPLSNQTACIDGYVNGWDHVCDHKIARSWPNNEIICPMTFGRASMNDTIPGSDTPNGNPHQIRGPWHYDARVVWQNTTNNGLPMSEG